MRIPVYPYTIAVSCFILVQLVLYSVSYARKSLNEHAPDCAISSLPVFYFLDNFTVTSPITNNMAGRSYDFDLVINTKTKSLNYGPIQV